MKATRKVVADAIECLLTCAADDLCTWEAAFGAPSELAGLAFSFVWDDVAPDECGPAIYGAAASLLHEGWLPDGWMR